MTEQPQRKHPLAKCEECPLRERGQFVPTYYNGNKGKKVHAVLVGEAPGGSEVRKGRPFIGISGHLLDETLKQSNISKRDVIYTNACLCRPYSESNKNIPPPADAVAACKPALDELLEESDPEYVVAMGNTATRSLLDDPKSTITTARVGLPKQVEGKRYRVIPTIHPAACLRNPNQFPLFVNDIAKLKGQIRVTWEPPTFKVLDNHVQARAAINQLLNGRGYDKLAVDLEVGKDKDEDFSHSNTLLCAGMAYQPGKVAVIGREALRSNAVRKDLSLLLQNKKLTWQHGKYDVGVLYRMGFGIHSIDSDTLLKSYTQNEIKGVHSLDYQGQEHLGTPNWKSVIKEHGGFENVPPDILHRYNAYDCAVTWDLDDYWDDKMDDDDRRLHEFLCRAAEQLALIESNGIYIDLDALDKLDYEMSNDIYDIKQGIIGLVESVSTIVYNSTEFWSQHPDVVRLMEKQGFNPNSTPQVAGFLEALTGATVTTTDADMMEVLLGHLDPNVQAFARHMIAYRKITKLHGTYVKGIRTRLDEDGRVRTTFSLHIVETGRLSSRNPNVQNVARESKYGNVRTLYAAAPGKRIVYADYANLEGRIVAHLAQSESMRQHMLSGNKIHNVIAEKFYGKNFDKEQYVLAKTVVHGANYARTPEGIAEGLGVSIREAQKVYNFYHTTFPEIKPWQLSIKNQVLKTDEILKTPFGRKRRFGLITRDNSEDVYKEALAFQPQSIGSDICLRAMIKLSQMGMPVRIPIHDGIVFEFDEDEVKDAIPVIREVMEESGREYTDYVPFPVDVEVGDNWGQLTEAE